jgi:hypothetical protein
VTPRPPEHIRRPRTALSGLVRIVAARMPAGASADLRRIIEHYTHG